MAAKLTSGAVCGAARISRGALRLYEREGLIAPPPRSDGGYRLYPEETIDLVSAIRVVKSLGFGLAEIKGMFSLLDAGVAGEGELLVLARRQLEALDERIEGLRELREGLRAFIAGDELEYDEDCAALARLLRRRRAAAAKKGGSRS